MSDWRRAPAAPRLAPGAVHVWRAMLRLPEATIDSLSATLSAEEVARAARLRPPHVRADFAASRGIQRAILSRYTSIAPEKLAFSYSPFGKPALGETGVAPGLCFNISNAGGMALIALTVDQRVGVDLEPIRPVQYARSIAERFFSVHEVHALRAAGPAEIDRSFLTIWTRKEAFIKAVGEGLSLPLANFDVACGRNEPARLLRTRPTDTARDWTMLDVDVGPGYLAALALEGALRAVHFYDWSATAE